MLNLALLATVAANVPLVALGCADRAAHLYARQAASASSVVSSSLASASGSAAPSSLSGTVSGNASATANATQISVSLISTNPTAVPLASITASQSSSATTSLPTTYAAGSTPSAVSNAPTLPDISSFNTKDYPTWDVVPPTNSSEVQQWIAEVQASGYYIPDWSPTNDSAACSANPEGVAETGRCWWTCSGCTNNESDIVACPDQLTWGLTYDDGPAFYTPNLLDYLDQQNLKTTFFTIGSRIAEFPHTLQTEYMGGHQIGVHTWSHPALTTLTNEQIIAEFGWTKKIIKDVLGVTPNTFRPPFGDIDDRVRAIGLAMGLKAVIWTRLDATHTFDTGDFNINSGTISSSQVIENFNEIMGNATTLSTGFIVLEHDLYEMTVELATGYILPEALAHQPPFKLEPVVTCLGMPLANAYIETNDNSTNPPPSSGNATNSSSGDSSSSYSAVAAVLPDLLSAQIIIGSSILGAALGFGSLLF